MKFNFKLNNVSFCFIFELLQIDYNISIINQKIGFVIKRDTNEMF
jgi:hypothetical protein